MFVVLSGTRGPRAAAGELGDNEEFSALLRAQGVEAWRDMRVRPRGSHHQKFVVLRHRDEPGARRRVRRGHRPVSLPSRRCRARRRPAALRHGEGIRRPPRRGTTCRPRSPGRRSMTWRRCSAERWEDPAPLDGGRAPYRDAAQPAARPRRRTRARCPTAAAGPRSGRDATRCSCCAPTRTSPPARLPLRPAAASAAWPAGTRKAVAARPPDCVYVEDQYLWSASRVGARVRRGPARDTRAAPGRRWSRCYPDAGRRARSHRPQLARAGARRCDTSLRQRRERVALYSLENHEGTPVYVHAKCCVVDDIWSTIGSDNFNRRSWTHDSELSAVVLDTAGEYARDAAPAPGRRAPGSRPRGPLGSWTTVSSPSRHGPRVRRVGAPASTRGTPAAGRAPARRAGCADSRRPNSVR